MKKRFTGLIGDKENSKKIDLASRVSSVFIISSSSVSKGSVQEQLPSWELQTLAAVSAPAARGLVEVKAHSLGAARFSVKVSRRTDILSVIRTQQTLQWGLVRPAKVTVHS